MNIVLRKRREQNNVLLYFPFLLFEYEKLLNALNFHERKKKGGIYFTFFKYFIFHLFLLFFNFLKLQADF